MIDTPEPEPQAKAMPSVKEPEPQAKAMPSVKRSGRVLEDGSPHEPVKLLKSSVSDPHFAAAELTIVCARGDSSNTLASAPAYIQPSGLLEGVRNTDAHKPDVDSAAAPAGSQPSQAEADTKEACTVSASGWKAEEQRLLLEFVSDASKQTLEDLKR